jgi:hypothetical protein
LYNNNLGFKNKQILEITKTPIRTSGGVKMITDSTYPDTKPRETVNGDKIKCDSCGRELRTSAEWLRTAGGYMCEICYRNLLFPDIKIGPNH